MLTHAYQLSSLRAPSPQWGGRETVMPRAGLEYFKRAMPPHAVISTPKELPHVPFVVPEYMDLVLREFMRHWRSDAVSAATGP